MFMIALAMRWGRREFGSFTAVATGLGLAISWWPIIFSRVGLRPIMEPFVLLIFAWFWPRRPWLAGIFLGLAVYTYTGARVVFLLPVLLFLYWLGARRWTDVRHRKLLTWQVAEPLRSSLIVLLAALLVAVPLFWTLSADPSLQQRVQQLEGPLVAVQQGNIRPILSTTLATLGVFSFNGDPRWTYALPDRPLFDPLTALFFYGGLLLAILRFKRPAYALALIWLLVGLIPSAVTPQAPSTIRLIGAMPVIYLMPALALSWLWQRAATLSRPGDARQRLRRGGLMVLLGLLFLLNLSLTVGYGFTRWPEELEVRLKYQSVWRDLANYLEDEPARGLVIADSFYRPITADSLRRNMNAPLPARWVQTGTDVAGALVIPDEDDGRLIVPEYAAPDPWLLSVAGIDPNPLVRSDERPSYAVYELPSEPAWPALVQQVNFANQITLVGYDTLLARKEGSLQLITVWRIEDTLPEDIAVFVHLYNEGGELVSQHDGFDAAPETLHEGDFVVQRHVLPLGGSLPDDAQTVHIGLYRRDDGQRFEVLGESFPAADQIVFPLDNLIVE
jgi:hypothetical protein